MHRFSKSELAELYTSAIVLGGNPSGKLTETIHFNHGAACPAGTDTKKRLYATPTDDGSGVLFYCHHCGGRGLHRLTRYTVESADKVSKHVLRHDGKFDEVKTSSTRVVDLEGMYMSSMNHTPPDMFAHVAPDVENVQTYVALADVWGEFKANNFYNMKVATYQNYYNKKNESVKVRNFRYYLPTLEEGRVTGLWIRQHPSSHNKVIVYGNAKKMLFDTKEEERFVVVVEDPISAIKLDCLGYPAYSLGGLDLSTSEVIKLRMMYDRVIVWLDNDKASEQAIVTVMRTLQLGGLDEVCTIRSAPEPKKCARQRIDEELTHIRKYGSI